ncbi:MAG: T9SS type A sorting domain-containing protein, partial [Candidatus Cloacimonetes bacterium]|nr:T9SS type A sorting domain-containing protein [Candidatus Cloacimonadota bacterium]
PDTYGYYCYDDGDTDYYNVPVYDWIEIDPAYGGSGTSLSMYDGGNDGDIEHVDLPFTFKFYGEDYNEITICSNGWLAPGYSENYDYMNWHLPGPLGPSPMIAPFWDDLKTSSGHICYYYDPGMHYFIVEWSHLQNEYNNNEETFQVILYDPVYYPTSTGDSEMKFQYKVVNNVDVGDYTSYHIQHGQYATVGIEDHTGVRGLEYSFNNTYPTAAKHLQNQMALLFTGPPIAPEEPFLVLGGVTIEDDNGNGALDYAENADLYVMLNNMGENAATGVTASISSDDAYITINQATSDYNTISGGSSGQNLTPFNLDVSANCPDGHNAMISINIQSLEDEWDLYFTLQLNAPLFSIQYVTVINDDNSNGILDPGETADLVVPIVNEGGAPCSNVQTILTTDDDFITIDVGEQNFDLIEPGAQQNLYYSLSVSEEADLGHSVVFSLESFGDFGYQSSETFSLTIGLCIENFESGNFLNFPWQFSGNADWTISSGAYEGSYCARSGTISDNQSSEMELEMYVLNNSTIKFYVKTSSEYSDYLNFYIDNTLINSWSGITNWMMSQTNVTAGNHTFKWKYQKNNWSSSGSDCAWVDMITFPANGLGASGTIEGTVELSANGNVEDVVISVGEYTTNPDQDGYYSLFVPYGFYDVSASMTGYETTIYEDFEIPPYAVVTRNFLLNYIAPPTNLTAELVGNTVYLEWNIPSLRISDNDSGIKNPREDSRVLQYFKVYRNQDGGDFIMIFATTQSEYTNQLQQEAVYGYYVTAIYTNNSESDPTETVYVNNTAFDDDQLPLVTKLHGNYPNPFNPCTTISFSLAEQSRLSLDIFNLKGERIVNLVDADLSPGDYNYIWNGLDSLNQSVPSGLYLYKISTGNYASTRKMILLR